MKNNIALKAQDLSGYYKGPFGVIRAVEEVSLIVERGETLGLAGESGCGKSTFLKLLTGIVEPPLHHQGGEVEVEGNKIYNMNPEELRKNVSGRHILYVPQSTFDSLNPTLRIREFIADMLRDRTGQKYPADEVRGMLADHFSKLGLDKRVLDLYPHELSGGMKQRALIAMSTYGRPSILLLDEPTSALDVTSQKRLIEMLEALHREEIIKTMIVSTHDVTILRQLCNRIAIMYAGKIVEVGNAEDVIENPYHTYTEMLINSLLPLERWTKTEKITGIAGRPPDLRSPPSGCRFHPRCPNCTDICMPKEPPLIEKGNRLVSCWRHCRES